MKVLVTGGESGQLQWELKRTKPPGVDIVNADGQRLDITDAGAVAESINQYQPDCIINAAAYTAVDKAEQEREQAFAVNQTGVQNLCDAALTGGSRLIHVSTDFVFGQSDGTPFSEEGETDPASVYGESKLAGEQAVRNTLPDTGLVVRTAWVYSSFGNNFVKTMLRLMRERDEIGVIADQVGSPTWANGLARALWRACEIKSFGMMQWTGAGVASWYDFAEAVQTEALALGLLGDPIKINPLRTDQYPTPARRPSYSVMEITRSCEQLNLKPVHWQAELKLMMSEL